MRNSMFVLVMLFVISVPCFAQTTEFIFQGNLKDGAATAHGNYDLEFRLFDALTDGSQIGSTLTRSNVAVSNGVFSVNLDFGSGFPGADRYLEIRVRVSGGGGHTILDPRQKVSSAPYAIKSLTSESATVAVNAVTANHATTANTANNALQLGGVTANQFVLTGDPRMSDARTPTVGSANYIQNQSTVPQTATNFNISGTGNANVFNAVQQFNLNGSRILSFPGLNNMFVGAGSGNGNTTANNNSFFGSLAGFATTTGPRNSFFGSGAGFFNTTGSGNSFFGHEAGRSNTSGGNNSFFGIRAGLANTGSDNSFFGRDAGAANSVGINNSFFGSRAGDSNTEGHSNAFFGHFSGRANTTAALNAFFGKNAGESNTTGSLNTFVGASAGNSNTTASGNSFFGEVAGNANSTGENNSFFGRASGFHNSTGSNNTMIGAGANVGAINLTFATAIGADTLVSTSNTVVLGRDLDIVRVPGFIRVVQLGSAGSISLCHNGNFTISTCSSSLRYKTNVNHFGHGLNLINQLKPITFDWKDGGMHDLGLGAEDVAAIEPLLVTYNTKGDVEGVKYDRIGVVLINAVKEQQVQIERQRKQIDALTRYICERDKTAAVCTP